MWLYCSGLELNVQYFQGLPYLIWVFSPFSKYTTSIPAYLVINTQLGEVNSEVSSKQLSTTNWQLPRALPRAFAKDWTTKAFVICPYRDWIPCCYSCWPSTVPEGVQGPVRSSVLQGICWDRSLDSWMLFGTDFMIPVLVSPHIWRSTKSLHSDIRSSWVTRTFCKMSASWHWTLPSPKPCILTFPHCCFGAVSQGYLRCCLLGYSLHFAPNKTNSQLSSCTSFFFF